MMRSLNISTKLSIAFGAAFALVVAIGLFAIFQLHTLNKFAANLTEVWLPEVETISNIKRAMTEHRMLAERRFDATHPAERSAIGGRMARAARDVSKSADVFRQKADTEEERRLLEGLVTEWLLYNESLQAVLGRFDSGAVEARADFQTDTLPTFALASSTADAVLTFVKEEGLGAVEEQRHLYRRFLTLTVAAILFGALCVGGGVLWVTRSISLPIRRISTAMHRLTGGDESVVIAEPGDRKDEIGDLIAAAVGYRDSLIRNRNLAEEATTERERLRAATENMPVGLSMFDEKKRLIICNHRFADIYGLSEELARPGTPLSDLLQHSVKFGAYPGDDPQRYLQDVLTRVEQREPSVELIELKDGRVLSISFQPMPSGGWVAIHEDVTARRRVEARIAYMARHDNLTDLPNRVLFRECLETALGAVKENESVAILYLDLDHFKSVNDTLGHPIGDALLKAVAGRLKGAIREQDTVARLGGDEFAVVQVGETQPVGSTALAERILETLIGPYDIEGHQVTSGASIGIAIAPSDGTDPDQLLKNSDMALYRAKQDGRGTYRFFEQDMDTRMQARRRLELDLRRALITKEFVLHYQPIFDLSTNEITGFEALIRWQHPERGMVSPAEFIPLAEEIGVIVPLGEWVLRQACLDAAEWPGRLKVAVNLSAVQFKSQKLLSCVIGALAASSLAPGRLELEITESVLLNDSEATLATLHQLRALGARISMDDFGTGYSSLSYLRSFPFDKIKIDQSFVQDSEHGSSMAIIRAVTGLSTSLGMSTTAEGVETAEQLARMREEGCTEIQGYLISPPRPAADVAEMLRSQQAARAA